MKVLVGLILCLNIAFSQEENTGIVKTSELELFLFKVGFESLLKDVDNTKNKTEINEEELKKLSTKVELIMNEIYKEKRIVNAENNSSININSSDNQEIENLKKEMQILKNQVKELSENKIINKKVEEQIEIKNDNEGPSIKNQKDENQTKRIAVDNSNVRKGPNIQSEIIEILAKDVLVEIESCDKYDWCKFKGEEKYISAYLLN